MQGLIRAMNPMRSWGKIGQMMRFSTQEIPMMNAAAQLNYDKQVGLVEREEVNHIDSLGRVYSTGRRKTSTARVWIKPGEVNCYINNIF